MIFDGLTLAFTNKTNGVDVSNSMFIQTYKVILNLNLRTPQVWFEMNFKDAVLR
jgi:hypothetical protein